MVASRAVLNMKQELIQRSIEALNARQESLNELRKRIDSMKEGIQIEFDSEFNSLMQSVCLKAEVVYDLLDKQHKNEQDDVDPILAECVTATSRLLDAPLDSNFEQVLTDYINLASQLPGSPSRIKQSLGIAMIILGMAVIAAAIAIIIMYPPLLVTTVSNIWTPFGPSALTYTSTHCINLLSTIGATLSGALIGLPLVIGGALKLREGMGNRETLGYQMTELHTFFNQNKNKESCEHLQIDAPACSKS